MTGLTPRIVAVMPIGLAAPTGDSRMGGRLGISGLLTSGFRFFGLPAVFMAGAGAADPRCVGVLVRHISGPVGSPGSWYSGRCFPDGPARSNSRAAACAWETRIRVCGLRRDL